MLSNLAEGLADGLTEGKASPTMTTAYRAFYKDLPPPVRQEDAKLLKTLKTFTYLASDDVEGRGLKRMGEPITRICYYKAELGQKIYPLHGVNTPPITAEALAGAV